MQLEELLERASGSTTHYAVLGIKQSATHGEIKLAYQKVIALLYPSYSLSASVPDTLRAKVRQVFERVSLAFVLLMDYDKRGEYDRLLLRAGISPQDPASMLLEQGGGIAATAAVAMRLSQAAMKEPGHSAININRLPEYRQVYSETSEDKKGDNRRRCQRFSLSLPVRVTGYDSKGGKW
jgi:curved DNA-binding protein CbpA